MNYILIYITLITYNFNTNLVHINLTHMNHILINLIFEFYSNINTLVL